MPRFVRVKISPWLFFFGIMILLTGVLSYGLVFKMQPAEATKVPAGVFVQGVDLSNLEKEQARQRIKEIEQDLLNKKVSFTYQGQTWSKPLKELGFVINVEDMVNQAMENSDSLVWRIKTYLQPVEKNINLSITIDKSQITSMLTPIAQAIERPAIDAKFFVDDHGQIVILPDQTGLIVNSKQIETDLMQMDLSQPELQIPLSINEIKATKTLADIESMGINGKLGEFTTSFDEKNSNRTTNIRIAAGKINGTILSPGQEFSFNKIVGERSQQAGYLPAAVVVANKFEEGLGGGICQVSTTLYNSILLANLSPVERHNHSLAISYVPLGRDAAVAWDQLDFKFKNPLPCHVYLRTVVAKNHITVQVYGDAALKKNITIRSWVTETIEADHVLKEIDPTLQPGEEVVVSPAYTGFRAKAERIIKENGAVASKEPLSDSYYRPGPKVIKVGPEAGELRL
ncbi:VanW family protein [Desulforamulus aeronauticus]|uniref:Putative peptidoglycan binding domain-containing protein n=1 Tax=Desulforamulus aeronauticus DSM 10349 TaxID=1121421 RepID=A0A1M6SQV7_9FIRM|nr:VanW family protein [Desulforamulus aeronauticus]SHK47103.1 Putative peptidoglycan binding domain-containing protein [Desulforamulus aeronauticus DSM 10349]